jgi:hypothetical protein
MPNPSVTVDIHQPFDVLSHLTTEIALHLVFRIDDLAQPNKLFIRQLVRFPVKGNTGLQEDLLGSRPADPIDVCQGNFEPFVTG